jgi:hypothetical protein
MTTSDGPAFEAIFTRVQKLYGKAKDGEMCRAYFDALKELPLTVVDAASHALIKTEKYFPRPVDWLDAAYLVDKPKQGFSKERWVHTASGERVATYVCLKCNDGGFRWECNCAFEDVDGTCATHKTGSSASRMPVTPCECRDTNPEWLMKNRTTHKFQEQR